MKNILKKFMVLFVVLAIILSVVEGQEVSAAKKWNPCRTWSKSVGSVVYLMQIENMNDTLVLDISEDESGFDYFLFADIKQVKGKKNVYKTSVIKDYLTNTKYNSIGVKITVYKKKIKVKLTGKDWYSIFGGPGSCLSGTWKLKK